MSFTTVPTRNPGDTIASADWNTYVRDNLNWLTSLNTIICYINATAAPSGWSILTAARGFFICGLVASGTLATAVGAALTDQQNISHTHSVPHSGWSRSGSNNAGRLAVDDGGGPGVGNLDASAANTSGGASAGSIGMPYISYLPILHQ